MRFSVLITARLGAILCLANAQLHHTCYLIVSLADAILQDPAAAAERPTMTDLVGHQERVQHDEG